ncbi:MAG TPA: YbaB/EbfC family nucleoid-associated protein [Streptosporangiaceae bacterium]|nr:YbaB/EbfC family nucleoid-associated protein [Streptosporangiaceae bacterium]
MSEEELNALLNRFTPSNPGKPRPWKPSADEAGSASSSSGPHAQPGSGAIAPPGEAEDDEVAVPSPLPALPDGNDLYAEENLLPDSSSGLEPELAEQAEEDAGRRWQDEGSKPLTTRMARFALSDGELRERFSVRSPDRHVEVVADVGGRLLALTIDPDSIGTAHLRQLSESVIAAVNAARDQADRLVAEAASRRDTGRE